MNQETSNITVPNLSAAELFEQAQSKLKLTYLDRDIAKRDFITDECGKTYEVRSWKPSHDVVPATEVRGHFTDGFVGNASALIALMMRDDPKGYHVSIPEDEALFQYGDGRHALSLLRVEGLFFCGFLLSDDVRRKWKGGSRFWAFRKVK